MSKDFAVLYATPNDSSGLEQKVFIKKEVTRGTGVVAEGTDFWLQNAGGSASLTKPFEPSAVRSGRSNVTGILKKESVEWSYPSYFMIDTTLGAAADAEIDPAYRVLFENALGNENSIADGAANLQYDTSVAPETSFTGFENGDVWAKQFSLGFTQTLAIELPGDGEASHTHSGMAREINYVGIGQSNIDNNGGNTVTVEVGDEKKFPIGSFVMIVLDDGTTRSADTVTGTARKVTDKTGQVITLDGAVLADADGSVDPVYLVYYEPETAVAINDPQTGLVGSITLTGYTIGCVASASINIENNHKVYDNCYGNKGLSTQGYAPTSRVNITLSLELMMSSNVLKLINDSIDQLDDSGNPAGLEVELILGDSTGRHWRFYFPKWVPTIPSIDVPEEGTIPVPFEGTCYATTAIAKDEILIEAK